MNFRFFIYCVEFCVFEKSCAFWWNYVRISWRTSEKNDVCRFFNRICENKINKLENCRKLWNQILWKSFISIHYYSFVSLGPRGRGPPRLGRGRPGPRRRDARRGRGRAPRGGDSYGCLRVTARSPALSFFHPNSLALFHWFFVQTVNLPPSSSPYRRR